MALGAPPNLVAAAFLLKAGGLGLAAGTAGALLGLGTALLVGHHWAGTAISPLVGTTAGAVAAAVAISLAAAVWPARQAANLDPCTCFQEV
jgi:ABC-type antimicrobial peptide transport system permease subunit